jgi:hypothetical protein
MTFGEGATGGRFIYVLAGTVPLAHAQAEGSPNDVSEESRRLVVGRSRIVGRELRNAQASVGCRATTTPLRRIEDPSHPLSICVIETASVHVCPHPLWSIALPRSR